MWVLTLFLGSLFLSLLWFYERSNDFTFFNWTVKILPVLIICQLFYWHAFRTVPNWITARYLMTVFTNILSWVLIIFILKEPVSVKQIIGIGFILTGGWLIK